MRLTVPVDLRSQSIAFQRLRRRSTSRGRWPVDRFVRASKRRIHAIARLVTAGFPIHSADSPFHHIAKFGIGSVQAKGWLFDLSLFRSQPIAFNQDSGALHKQATSHRHLHWLVHRLVVSSSRNGGISTSRLTVCKIMTKHREIDHRPKHASVADASERIAVNSPTAF